MTTKSLRSVTLSFGEGCIGFYHNEVCTHSLWSCFSMELSIQILYSETIMSIGIWYRNAFVRYIRIQVSNLSKRIRDLMVSIRDFYTVPETEVIYYTPGQPVLQYHRLNPHRGITNTTTYLLSLPRWNGPQGRNTHATCSEISEQQYGNMV